MKSNLGLVLFSLLVLFSPLYTTAEETGLAEKTFSKADLLVHIEKAERGVRAEDWESILREDLSAVPSWESAELLAEFEGRFGVWLGKRASESLPKADLGGFLEELADADRAYLVETDSSGKVKYDEAGDPVFKGLAGYQADESAWKSRLETKMNEALALWERDAKVECQELLAPLSGDLAAIGTVRLTASLAEYKAATHREFDRLYRSEETRFAAARLKDSYSLRKKAEDKSALGTATSLVAAAEEDLAAAKRTLATALTAGTEAGTSAILVNPETWQEDFKREFNKGLETWNKAERKLLSERLAWETGARNGYVEAEAAWDAAFTEFAKGRNGWLKDMRGLVESGRANWELSERNFLENYETTMTGLAKAASTELSKLREEAASYLDIYRQSVSFIEMAEENAAVLEAEVARLRERSAKLLGEIPAFEALIPPKQAEIEKIRNMSLGFDIYKEQDGTRWKCSLEPYFSPKSEVAEREGRFWDFLGKIGAEIVVETTEIDMDGTVTTLETRYFYCDDLSALTRLYNGDYRKTYSDQAKAYQAAIDAIETNELAPRRAESEDILANKIPELQNDIAYWTGPSGVKGKYEISRKAEEKAIYDLEAKLAAYGGSEITTDSLDREIERLQAELGLRNEQVEIARAVLAYAQDTSSSRPTEAETSASLAAARSAFDAAEAAYREAVTGLTSHISGAMGLARRNVAAAKEALAAAGEELEAVRTSYENTLNVYRTNDITILQAVSTGYQEEIDAYYKANEGRAKDWQEYIAAWEAYQRAGISSEAAAVVKDLNGEGDFDDFPDLAKLRAKKDALSNLGLDWTTKEDAENLKTRLVAAGVSSEEARGIADLYAAAFSGGAYGRTRAEQALAAVKASSALELGRWSGLRDLLTQAALSAEDGKAFLVAAEQAKKDAELEARAEKTRLELAALGVLRNGTAGASQDAIALAAVLKDCFGADYRGTDERRALLQDMTAVFDALRAGTLSLAEAAKNAVFRSYLASSGPLGAEGEDLRDSFAAEELYEKAKASALLSMYEAYGKSSPALLAYYRDKEAAGMTKVFEAAQYASRADLKAFLASLSRIADIPAPLSDALTRYLSLRAKKQGLSLAAAPGGTGTDYDALLLAVTDPSRTGLAKAGVIFKAGLSGARSFLLAEAKSYIAERRAAAGTCGEEDATYLAEALSLAGLDAGSLALEEIGSFSLDLSVLDDSYAELLDGDRAVYFEAKYRPADFFASALLLARTAKTGSETAAFEVLAAEYLKAAMAEAKAKAEQATAEASAEALLKQASGFASVAAKLDEDLAFYLDEVKAALAAYGNGTMPTPKTLAEAQREQVDVVSGEKRIVKTIDAKAKLDSDIEIFRQQQGDFKKNVLEPKQREMDAVSDRQKAAQAAYDVAVAAFGRESKRYGELEAAVEAARTAYGQARFDLRKAEDLRDYAAGGYTPKGFDPATVLSTRIEEREKTAKVLAMLRDVQAKPEKVFGDRLDAAYGSSKTTERERLDALQYLAKAGASLDKETGTLRKDLVTALAGMQDAMRNIFGFLKPDGKTSLAFTVDKDYLPGKTLVDFAAGDETTFKNKVDAYFTGSDEDLSKKISCDALLWAQAMAAYGPEAAAELIKRFGLAYYYDAAVQKDLLTANPPTLSVALFSNQAWVKLVGDYVSFGSKDLPICDPDNPETIIGYTTYYPEEKWTVDDYVKNKTEGLYNGIAGDANLYKLYSFYKMMMATGNVKDGTSYIQKDVGDLVFDHVDDAAMHRQEYCSRWWRPWLNAEGRRIRELRVEIKAARDNGGLERQDIAKTLGSLVGANITRAAAQDRLDGLLGSGVAQSSSSFLDVLEQKTGSGASAELARIVNQIFPDLNEAQRKNTVSLLTAAQEAVKARAADSASKAQARANVLGAERLAAYQSYRTLLAADTLDEAAVRTAINGLYDDPAFTWEDEAEYSLAMAKSVSGLTLRGEADKLGTYITALENRFKVRLDTAQEEARESLLGELATLRERRSEWETQVQDLVSTGMNEWQTGAVNLYGQRKRWEEEYAKEYEEKNLLWEAKYQILRNNRETWVRESAERTIAAGTEGIAHDFGLETARLEAEVESIRIPDMSLGKGDLEAVVAKSFDGKLMSDLLAEAKELSRHGATERPVVAAFLPEARDTSGALAEAESFARGIGTEIYQKASLVAALEMRKALEEAEDGVTENVAEANKSVDKNLTDTFKAGGYARKGLIFERKVVIDETVFGGIEREKQTVDAYRYFSAPAYDHGVDLSRKNLEGMSGEYIQAMVKTAQENLSKYLKLIFGRDEKEDGTIDTWSWSGTEGVQAVFEAAETAYKASAGYGRKNKDGEYTNQGKGKDGLFTWHVGYAPEMDKESPEKVKEAGYGELGRIMAQYLTNEARWTRGLASFDIAWYNRKLWDDDKNNDGKSDGMFGAPTVRSATNIAVAIAASAITGGASLSAVMACAALNMADDVVFTMMDVNNGTMNFGDGMMNLGKQSAVSLATAGISYGGAQLDGLLNFGGGFTGAALEVSTDVAITGLKTVATTYSSAAINSVKLGRNGFGFEENAFQEATNWNNFGSRLGVDLAKTGVTSGMDSFIRGYVGETYGNAATLNGLAGNLTGNALEYGLSGRTQFNVANFSMFGLTGENGQAIGGGLVELNLGGENLFTLGQNGTDVSAGMLYTAYQGLDAYKQNSRIWEKGLEGDLATAMKTAYSNGSAEGRRLYEEVLAGTTYVTMDESLQGDGLTERDRETGARVVRLRGGNGKNSDLQLGVTLSHEAYRNGYDDGNVGQRIETNRAVMGHIGAAGQIGAIYGEGVLREDMKAEVALQRYAQITGDSTALDQYINTAYDSSGDYWKLMKDGTLVKDKDGWLRNENGEYILDKKGNRIGAEGIETGLLNILYGGTNRKAYESYSDKQIKDAQKLMTAAEFSYTETNGYKSRSWVNGNEGKFIDSSSILSGFGDTVAAAVFVNGLDRLSDSVVFGDWMNGTMSELIVPAKAQERFTNLVEVKKDFYYSEHKMFDPADEKKLTNTGTYGPDAYYKDGQHKGNDLAGPLGTKIYSDFGGKVIFSGYDKSAGNTAIVNLGFGFENYFYETGVQAQFMHLNSTPTVTVNQLVAGDALIGYMGTTGDSTGSHLHYQLMGNMGGRSLTPTSSQWDMYRERRDTFLSFFGGVSTGNWIDRTTFSSNYWNADYKNFYYNTNNFLKRYGNVRNSK